MVYSEHDVQVYAVYGSMGTLVLCIIMKVLTLCICIAIHKPHML